MRICAISDLHGHLIDTPECDLLIIAGDVCPIIDHSVERQKIWLNVMFKPWLQKRRAHNIIGIAGNHDFVFEHDYIDALPWFYLEEDTKKIDGINIYGHPYVPNLSGWAFSDGSPDTKVYDDRIPDDTDILVTHGPPMGILDTTYMYPGHLGSMSMLTKVKKVKPKMHIFGHIHDSNGSINIGHTRYINGSICDEEYNTTGHPVEFILKSMEV